MEKRYITGDLFDSLSEEIPTWKQKVRFIERGVDFCRVTDYQRVEFRFNGQNAVHASVEKAAIINILKTEASSDNKAQHSTTTSSHQIFSLVKLIQLQRLRFDQFPELFQMSAHEIASLSFTTFMFVCVRFSQSQKCLFKSCNNNICSVDLLIEGKRKKCEAKRTSTLNRSEPRVAKHFTRGKSG